VLLPFAGARDLFDADEGRYAAVAYEMAETGEWLSPTVNGLPFMDKPPLVYWIQVPLMRLVGPSPWAARAPTLLAGCLWTLFIFLFAARWTGARRSAYAAAALAATSAAAIVGSRVGPQMDMPLAACIAGALYAALRALEQPEERLPRIGLGVAIGLGLLVKGPLVAAVPFLVAVAWAIAGVSVGRIVRTMLSPWAWGAALLIAAPWYVAFELKHPGWIEHFIVYEHFGRFGQGDHRNFHPFWFYVPVALLYMLPWTPMAWAAPTSEETSFGQRLLRFPARLFVDGPWWRRPWRALASKLPLGNDSRTVDASHLAWGWFLAAFLLYSVSTRKLLNYLLPAAAPLFVLLGARFDQLVRARRALPFALPAVIGAAVLLAGVAIHQGWWFPLVTGRLPSAIEHPRFETMIPFVFAGGAILLAGSFLGLAMRRTPFGALCVVLSVASFWWSIDMAAGRAAHLGSARGVAEALAAEVGPGDAVVALKRYPQGLRLHRLVPVWMAGGEPGAWHHREIVDAYATPAWEAMERDAAGAPIWTGWPGVITSAEFERLWASGQRVVVICRWAEVAHLRPVPVVMSGPFAGAGRTDLYVVANRAQRPGRR